MLRTPSTTRRRGLALAACSCVLALSFWTPGRATAVTRSDPRTAETPEDRLLVAGEHLSQVDARGGRVVWTHRESRRRYRLEGQDHGDAIALPTAVSSRRLRPHLGTDSDGAPDVAYVRCRADGVCRPFSWSFTQQRERRLPVGVRHGCTVTETATWGATIAYVVQPRTGARCSYGDRGLWLKTRSALRRRSATASRLSGLEGRLITWIAPHVFHYPDFDDEEDALRVSRLDGRARTVAVGDADCCIVGGGSLDGGYIYWWTSGHDERLSIARESVRGARECRYWPSGDRSFPARDGVDAVDFSVDDARVLYIADPGVLELAPQRLRWHRC